MNRCTTVAYPRQIPGRHIVRRPWRRRPSTRFKWNPSGRIWLCPGPQGDRLKYTLTTKLVSTLKAGPCPQRPVRGGWTFRILRERVYYPEWGKSNKNPNVGICSTSCRRTEESIGKTDRPENPSEKGRSKPSLHLQLPKTVYYQRRERSVQTLCGLVAIIIQEMLWHLFLSWKMWHYVDWLRKSRIDFLTLDNLQIKVMLLLVNYFRLRMKNVLQRLDRPAVDLFNPPNRSRCLTAGTNQT